MPKKGRPPIDPLRQIASSGFIGYVEEEEVVHTADEPGVLWVEIEKIHDNPYQHAEEINPDDFQALVESIKADGFQGALNVSPRVEQESTYFLTGGGHQRRNAAQAAGLKKLPVFVTPVPANRIVLALRAARENTTRVNTSIVNLGYLYQHIIDEFQLTQEQIAQAIGKDRNHVKFALMAVRSPADIQAMLRQKPDSVRAMVYFRRLEREEDRQPIMERFLAGELSTDDVRREVDAVLEAHKPAPTPQPVQSADDVQHSSYETPMPAHAPSDTAVAFASTAMPTSGAQTDSPPSAPSPLSHDAAALADAVEQGGRQESDEVTVVDVSAHERRIHATPVVNQHELLRQARTLLHTLRSYHEQGTPRAGFSEETYRLLEEIQQLTNQLLK